MNSATVKARSAGLLYLLMLIIGGFNLVYNILVLRSWGRGSYGP